MSTSLAEQLRRLQTPQSSQFIEVKKRDSILFTSKEAATKSRETIYEIGISGLSELIELNSVFQDFQSTLFEVTAKDVQRAVEMKEVNELLNKNIKRFMFHLSPYFMIPASHKCLEWLIRRFSINLYNKEEFLMLILPYHQTNMFVRCIQSMRFDDPTDKWSFLAEVKKSSAPLSKYALWNQGATQPSFLGFVGKFTQDAIKELGNKAGSLQTMIAFYCTTLIGAMDQAPSINDNHILFIAKYLVKAYKSNVADFAAAGYMITAQLLVKTKLGIALLNEIMDKITSNFQLPLSQNIILLMSLMFQSQNDELKITDKTLENIMSFKWLPSALDQMKSEGKPSIAFYRALICKLLDKIGDKSEDFMIHREYIEALTGEIVLDDEEAQVIIR
jgi:U3 small nucleolar RNA-associated protein 10